MKYDESVCKFNMDTGCVELLLRDGRKISIDCTGVEDALVAQLDRVSDYESEGRGFESLPAHQTMKIRTFSR